MMALYIPGQSMLHRLPATPKLLALPAAASGLFWLDGPAALAVANAAVVALYALARLPLGETARALRPALVLLLAILLIHGALTDWQTGSVIVLRIAALMLLATLVTLTTRLTDMIDTLERAMAPLRLVGVSPARAGLVLSLAIRLVPLLLAELELVREAQRARGLERGMVSLMLPFLVGSLRLARDLGDAIEARGVDPH
jgi:biotin transport system permease protein